MKDQCANVGTVTIVGNPVSFTRCGLKRGHDQGPNATQCEAFRRPLTDPHLPIPESADR